jgi:hypothetical protein
MARQGYDLQLTRYDEKGWRATFYTTRDGALAHECDRHRMGAHAAASRAECGVGGAEESVGLDGYPALLLADETTRGARGEARFMTPFLIVNLAGLIAISILLAHYWWEKRILSGFVHSSFPPSESTFGTALGLAGRIYVQVSRGSDPPFIPIAALDIVGATPVSILRRGGCCSGFARLYITGLGTLASRQRK